jgi:hypothetical protein
VQAAEAVEAVEGDEPMEKGVQEELEDLLFPQ